jgi:hypothetical protein
MALFGATMNFQDHALPDNVVMFPGAHRRRPLASAAHAPTRHPAAPRRCEAAARSGNEINARLMVLLGICVTGAAAVISAAHFVQG